MNNKATKKTDWKKLSSKVCKIANKIPHTVSRKEAFIRAWEINVNNLRKEQTDQRQK